MFEKHDLHSRAPRTSGDLRHLQPRPNTNHLRPRQDQEPGKVNNNTTIMTRYETNHKKNQRFVPTRSKLT